jgi:hypothetical protein
MTPEAKMDRDKPSVITLLSFFLKFKLLHDSAPTPFHAGGLRIAGRCPFSSFTEGRSLDCGLTKLR